MLYKCLQKMKEFSVFFKMKNIFLNKNKSEHEQIMDVANVTETFRLISVYSFIHYMSNGLCFKIMNKIIFLFTTCFLLRSIVHFCSLGGHKLKIFNIFYFLTQAYRMLG